MSSGTRNCVQCGRSIPWDANVCQFCGHDYRIQMAGQPQDHVGTGLRVVLYLISFFIPFLGFLIGIIMYASGGSEHKHVGKMCVLIALLPLIIVVACGLLAGLAWLTFW